MMRTSFILLIAFLCVLLRPQMLQAQGCCNILTNGNFESGNTEFTSGLNPSCACISNSYCVGTNFQAKCTGWPNFTDHTGGGSFLIIDGNSGAPADVWRKSTQILSNVTYCFTFWVASVYDAPFDLGLTVNGVLVPGATFNVQQGTPSWTQYSFTFTGVSGSILAIRQLTGGAFRDFGLDDIEFGSPITPDFAFTPDLNCEMNLSFFNQSTGPATLTYAWNFGDVNSGVNNTSTQTNPKHKFTDCGTYNVCLTVSRGTCSQTICKSVLVQDNVPPTALCLGVGVVLGANCKATITPATINAGSFDDCYIASLSVSPSVLTGCGVFPVTLTVKDSCGNTSTCTANVQTIETIPPTITCPANVSVNAIPTSCSIAVNSIQWLALADNCGIPTVNYVVTGATPTFGIKDVSGTAFNQGISTVIYTAMDGCGNTATCSFTVTVTCQDENCVCPGLPLGANLIPNGNFSSGNSGFTSQLIYSASCAAGFYGINKRFDLFCTGWNNLQDHTNDIQRNFLIIDGADNGNTMTDLWKSNVVLTANSNYCFSFWWASAYTNADANFQVEVYIEESNGTEHSLGIQQITQTMTQWSQAFFNWNSLGLTGSQSIRIRQVTGDDHRDFGIDDICFRKEPCEANFTFLNINDCGKVQFTSQSTGPAPLQYCWDFDNNPATCESTLANPMWQFPTCGTYNVCLTITGNGCTSTICHTVVVNDNVPPVAVCNLGVGVTLLANCTFPVSTAFVDGGSTDNCQIKSLSVTPSVLTGCGNTIVTLTVTDWCNNTSTCTMGIQTIEVVPPTITCPASISVNAIPASCSIAVNGISFLSANDNCGFPTITHTINAGTPGSANASGTIFNQGVSNVIYTATDGCGNTATCSFTVTVTCQAENCACPGGPISANLITNGNFASGNAGFTSGLTSSTGCGTGQYGIANNFNLFCSSWPVFSAFSSPNCLLLDGSNTPGPTVLWQSQLISLTPNMNYCFSFWWASVISSPTQSFPVEILILNSAGTPIIGSPNPVGTQIIAQNPAPMWQQSSFNWSSGSLPSGSYYIAIRQLTGSLQRDWAIDDICFKKITPPPICTADFNVQSNSCGKYTFNGFANGTPGYSYAWNFGDSNSGANNTSTLQNPMHQFSAGGTYTVTLTITDATGCIATYSATVTVPPFPTVNIVGNPGLTICSGQSTTLTVTGGPWTTCLWNTSQSGQSISVGIPGTYCVTCTDMSGCTASACVQVDSCCKCPVNAIPGPELVTNGDFSAPFIGTPTGFTSSYTPLTTICSPGQYSIANSITVVPMCNSWGGIDHTTGSPTGQFFVADGSQAPNVAAWSSLPINNIGTNVDYKLCAYVNNLNLPSLDLADPIVEVYIVDASNNATFLTSVTPPESPDVWLNINAIWNSPPPGPLNIPYHLEFRTGSNSFGGNNFALDDISFRACTTLPCTADFNFQPTGVCHKYLFNGFASGTPGYSYSWNFGDSNSGANNTSTLQNPMHQFSASGTYTVTLTITDATGCVAIYSATLTVPALPIVTISGNLSVCSGQSTTLTASGTGTYVWSAGGATTPSITVTPTIQSHTYSVTCTDLNGCTATATVNVQLLPLPNFIPVNQTICEWQSATLSATGGGTYLWSVGNQTTASIVVSPAVTTVYTVTVTSTQGCTNSVSMTVKVVDCDCNGSIVKNGNFILGIQPGNLGNPGAATFWNPIATPQVVTSDGHVQPGCMQMWGNRVVGEGIEQPVNIQPGCTYQISYCAKYLPINDLSAVLAPQVRFRATTGPGIVTSGNYGALAPTPAGSILMGNSPTLTQGWLPYSFTWTAPYAPVGLNNLVISVWNNQAVFNPTKTSWIRVDSICIQKIGCPMVECGPFTHLGFGYEKGPFKPANCGNTSPIILQCPISNQKFYFTGEFSCLGGTTSGTPVSWEIWKSGATASIATGTTVATPFFGVQLFSSYFTAGGVYELRIKGFCGDKVCDCIIKFEIPPCADSCPCDGIAAEVAKGFYQTSWIKYCRTCFTPIGLKDCDRVEWSITPTDTSYVNPVGVSNGNKAFCFSFSTGGIYTVTMHVIRQRPDGTTCEATFYKKIFVKCHSNPDCDNTVLSNPEFGEGAASGVLGDIGKSDDWLKVSGNPSIKDTSEVGADGWSVMLSGNDNTYDAIRTDASYCFQKDTGTITLMANNWRIDHTATDKNTMIFVNLVRGDAYPTWPCSGDNCYEIACLEFPAGTNEWVEFQFDYDLRNLLVSDICDSSSSPTVKLRPVIYIGNWLSDAQGGDLSFSQVLIDQICLQGRGTVPTYAPLGYSALRIFPNPNPGVFTVELPQPATAGITLRITDLTGRLILEKQTEPGSTRQIVQAESVPNGLYLLQVVSAGNILATEKFVKQ